MAAQNTHRDSAVDLTREEQWVLHDVILDRIEMELRVPEETDPPDPDLFRVFEKVEAGTYRFSEDERQCIETELRGYADARDTPERDLSVVERVVDRFA